MKQMHMDGFDASANFTLALVRSLPRKRAKLEAALKAFPALSPRDRCLDIGVGSGGVAAFYAREGDWTFLDPSFEHLNAAKKLLRGQFVQMDGQSYLDKSSAKFDLISCIAVLFFFPDQLQFFRDLGTHLSPDGYLLVSGDDTHDSPIFGTLRRRLGIYAATGGTHDVGLNKVRKGLLQAGYIIEAECLSCGPATLAAQSALDALLVFVNRGKARANDSLTLPISGEMRHVKLKFFALFVLRGLTNVCLAVDSLLRPRYEFIIRAKRGTPTPVSGDLGGLFPAKKF